MKKLKFLILIATILFSVTSCDDSNDGTGSVVYEKNPIKITSVERLFNPEGGTNSITVNKNIQTAYSSESWAEVSVTDSTVKVKAAENNGRFNRHANIVLKASEKDSTIVTVTQKGLIFSIGNKTDFVVGNDAIQEKVSLITNTTVIIKFAPDWVNPEITDDGILLNIKKNESGEFRKGVVTFAAGSNEVSVSVLQGSAENLSGSYNFFGTDASGNQVSLSANLIYKDGSVTLTFPDLNWSFTCPLTDDLYFDLPTLTYVGTYDKYYIGIVLRDDEGKVSSYNKKRSYRCKFIYDDTEKRITGKFIDNGSWPDYTVSCIRFEAFKTETIGTSSRTGIVLFSFVDPWMEKIK